MRVWSRKTAVPRARPRWQNQRREVVRTGDEKPAATPRLARCRTAWPWSRPRRPVEPVRWRSRGVTISRHRLLARDLAYNLIRAERATIAPFCRPAAVIDRSLNAPWPAATTDRRSCASASRDHRRRRRPRSSTGCTALRPHVQPMSRIEPRPAGFRRNLWTLAYHVVPSNRTVHAANHADSVNAPQEPRYVEYAHGVASRGT